MANNTSCTITITEATKKFTQSALVADKETIDLNLVNTGTATATDIVAKITNVSNEVLASADDFTAGVGQFEGTMDLNTTEMIAEFTNKNRRDKKIFQMTVWDSVNDDLLANDNFEVIFNAYPSGEPTELGVWT